MPMFGPYPAVVTDLHDGDTLHLNIDLGFGYIVSGHDLDGNPQLSCRVFGINAPELRTTAGKAALQYATSICPPGTRVTVTSHGWDKYGGRFDGELILPDGTSFAERMLDAGQAVPLTTTGGSDGEGR